jgi:2-polyprenyl-3-methyl-5-hydroxy-6-metoxy-1,4-benzoquinol methylase
VTDKNIIHEKAYWDTFYDTWGLDVPSQFCVQAVTDISRGTAIVEFGSGNGRDSQYMASQGYVMTAMDLSESAIALCNEKMAAKNIHHAFFTRGDVSLESDVVGEMAKRPVVGHSGCGGCP